MASKPSPAPNRCPSPDPYFHGVHSYSPRTYSPVTYSSVSSSDIGPPNRDYEYVGMPLTPPPLPQNYQVDEDEDSGPSTAEIIANQSQDYIDEKLAEYQATIYLLQGKRLFSAESSRRTRSLDRKMDYHLYF
ncbi:hypothetical protein YQE_10069, partial [Dendroctonus ponderosae]